MKNCSITSKNVISSNCFPDINVSIYKNPCDSLPLDSNKICLLYTSPSPRD